MIKVVGDYVPDGHDCWGKSEWKYAYKIIKDNRVIAELNFNPAKLFKIFFEKNCFFRHFLQF